MPASVEFQRTTFATSRLLEFFSEKELTMQIGHPASLWPLALLKELLDNALDAAESAGNAPVIIVTVTPDTVSVQDNGGGLPIATLERSLDYLVRVSDKSHYVSPTRGQLGNALKCIWAAPFVVDGEHGRVSIETGGQRHIVDVRLDRILQAPTIDHQISPDGEVPKGTRITLHWPEIASSLESYASASFYNGPESLIAAYAAFNPHATLTLRRMTEEGWTEQTLRGSEANWQHWLPSQPTSPHWYTVERLAGLIAAHLAEEERGAPRRSVRELVSDFRGLTGTAKQKGVCERAMLGGARLHDLVVGGDIDRARVRVLLEAMQAEARPVQPMLLGALGQAHLTRHLVEQCHARPETVRYAKKVGEADGVPFVLETASGVRPPDYGRIQLVGLNWSPALGLPFRQLGQLLGSARVDPHDPIALVIHVACPRLDFADRGKGVLA